ncbi:MAG: FHA domain-containing protein [bacterium]
MLSIIKQTVSIMLLCCFVSGSLSSSSPHISYRDISYRDISYLAPPGAGGIFLHSGIKELIYSELSGAEQKKVLDNTEIHGDAFNDSLLATEFLEEHNLAPQYKVQVNGDSIVMLSKPYNLYNGRIAVVAYVEVGAGEETQEKKYIARTYYRSNSHGNWRYLPAYETLNDAARDTIGWFSKGYFDASVTLPWQLQPVLSSLSIDPHNILNDMDEQTAEFVCAGTARNLNNYSDENIDKAVTFLREVDSLGSVLTQIDDQSVESIHGIRQQIQRDRVPPGNVRFHGDEKESAPNFNNLIRSFKMPTSLYGTVDVEIYASFNGTYHYMFCSTQHTKGIRAWIAGIEYAETKLSSQGLHAQWVYAPELTTPLCEYKNSFGGDRHPEYHEYYDMWEKYISQIPVIQEYVRFKLEGNNEINAIVKNIEWLEQDLSDVGRDTPLERQLKEICPLLKQVFMGLAPVNLLADEDVWSLAASMAGAGNILADSVRLQVAGLIFDLVEQYFSLLPPQQLKILVSVLYKHLPALAAQYPQSLEEQINRLTNQIISLAENPVMFLNKKNKILSYPVPLDRDVWIQAGSYYYRIWISVTGMVRIQQYDERDGEPAGKVLMVKNSGLQVGRMPDNDCIIDDLGLSRNHFSVKLFKDTDKKTHLLITDLESTNGTKVYWETPLAEQIAYNTEKLKSPEFFEAVLPESAHASTELKDELDIQCVFDYFGKISMFGRDITDETIKQLAVDHKKMKEGFFIAPIRVKLDFSRKRPTVKKIASGDAKNLNGQSPPVWANFVLKLSITNVQRIINNQPELTADKHAIQQEINQSL